MTTAGPNGRRRSGSGATLVQFNVNDRYNQSDQADSVIPVEASPDQPNATGLMLIGAKPNPSLYVPRGIAPIALASASALF